MFHNTGKNPLVSFHLQVLFFTSRNGHMYLHISVGIRFKKITSVVNINGIFLLTLRKVHNYTFMSCKFAMLSNPRNEEKREKYDYFGIEKIES